MAHYVLRGALFHVTAPDDSHTPYTNGTACSRKLTERISGVVRRKSTNFAASTVKIRNLEASGQQFASQAKIYQSPVIMIVLDQASSGCRKEARKHSRP
jgi:hypothetical protein